MSENANQVAKNWMNKIVETAANRQFDEHMDLISKKVNITGIPDFENIGYEDWAKQCKHEFENNIIKSISYQGLKLQAHTESRVMFKTYEAVEANDGTVNAQGIEVLLEKEQDTWRVVQERILPIDEVKHDRLLD
ncbi:MAG: nuclear transport factor 2 family protein [Thiohalomonadales bacterium]